MKTNKILVVDDERSVRYALSKVLRAEGYHVVLVENGREAVERACAERFDLVLLDLSMPEMNGWEALKEIATAQPVLPVIIITAHQHQRDWIEPDGAWALMEKPLNIPLLLVAIREMAGGIPSISQRAGAPTKPRFKHWPADHQSHFNDASRPWGINE